MTLEAGARIGAYEILSPLGAGGMGEVYRARDPRLAREVAIKVLPPALAGDSQRLERFEKEARTASALNHPNIVTIYEIGRTNDTSFIAMELVAGKTLREILLAGGALPFKRLIPIAAQAADGLAKAHSVGIVHRDLKPENLMITKDGLVKILDFGLAKLVPGGYDSSEGTNLPTMTRGTEEGTILGTVGYMSPEQASGDPLDFRSDQFALGAMLYEMAAGRRAFERRTPVQTLTAIIEDEPPPLGTVAPNAPVSFVTLVERCLGKDPEQRYGSTKDLAFDLGAMRSLPSGVPDTAGESAPRGFWRPRLLAPGVLVAATAVAVVSFLVGDALRKRRDRETPPPAARVLTHRRGYLTGARFAPDGQTIVYSAAWDGKPSEIFEARADGTESRPKRIFPAGILAVSSSGEMAISLGCEDRWDPCFGTLARAPLAGGAPRELMEDVGSADWSPDGKELAAIHVVEGRYRIEYPLGKVLYKTDGALTAIRVSPKGDLVSFLEHPNRDSRRGFVCVVDRTGHKRALTGELSAVDSTLWSPDSQEVFFAGNKLRRGVREVEGVRLTGNVRQAPWIPGLDDVSRQGLFLSGLFGWEKRADISARAPGSSKERNLSWLGASEAADLSPDGRHLLFFEFGRAGSENWVTYLRDTDGADPAMLGEGKAMALSPDRKWALVVVPVPAPHLMLLPTGAGEPRPLPSGSVAQYHWATFFPDSRRILFVAEEKGHPVRSYIQNIDGGAAAPFAEEGFRAEIVSPDSSQIAGSTQEGLPLIFPVSGEGRARAIDGVQPGEYLVQWSEDGKSLYVRGTEEAPLQIYRVDLASGKRESWLELSPADNAGFIQFGAGPKGVRIAPNGQFYAYTYWSGFGRLVVTDVGTGWWQ